MDLRIERSQLSFTEEKQRRQIEIKAAVEQKQVCGKLRFFIQGKAMCLQGYMALTCVPKSSGAYITLTHSYFFDMICEHPNFSFCSALSFSKERGRNKRKIIVFFKQCFVKTLLIFGILSFLL